MSSCHGTDEQDTQIDSSQNSADNNSTTSDNSSVSTDDNTPEIDTTQNSVDTNATTSDSSSTSTTDNNTQETDAVQNQGEDDTTPENTTTENTTTNDSTTENNVTVSFLALGDTGTGDSNQQSVADAMETYCTTHACDFAILLGDNFYPSGVTSTSDALFQSAFEIPYANLNFIFYPVLGNHDIMGSYQAEIDYSSLSEKWEMPARYYVLTFSSSDEPLVDLIAIDSTNFDSDQATWLESELNTSTAVWKILYDHYPFYSNGLHGDNSGGILTAAGTIVCNKIDLVISGHDHNQEHLMGRTGDCELQQVVLGSGGRSLYTVTADERTLFAESSFGFGWFEVTEDKISFEFLNAAGEINYQYDLEKISFP